MGKGSIHSGHRDRMRNRFLTLGSGGFSEHEILELLLFYSIPRANTNETAHALIERFGSLENVLAAAPEELMTIKGIKSESAFVIRLMHDLCKRYSATSDISADLSDGEKLEGFLTGYFSENHGNVCLLLDMTPHGELRSTKCLPTSALLSGELGSREIAELVVRNGFIRVVIGQCIDGEQCVPDVSCYSLTRLFAETLAPLGTELHDHIICCSGKCFSMRKNGSFSFGSGGNHE